jgi:hypothetical protein
MPNHDEGHADGPTIEVTAKRPNNTLSADGGGGGFYNFGGGHDAFHFTNPFFADGGGDGGGGGSTPNPPPNPPEDEGPEIIVTAPRSDNGFPLTDQEFIDTRDAVFDYLEYVYHGYYRFALTGDQYQLEIFDYENGETQTYIFSQNGGFTFTTPLDSSSFDVPDGAVHTGRDIFQSYDTEYF